MIPHEQEPEDEDEDEDASEEEVMAPPKKTSRAAILR